MKSVKAVSYGVLAAIEIFLVIACYCCGRASMRGDKEKAELEEQMAEDKQYQRVAMDDGGQIMS